MRTPLAQGRGPHGFTLIEVLIVVVIMAVLTTIAVLSIGVIGKDRELESEGDRLTDVIAAASEQAQLEGRDYGIWFNQGRYQVLVHSLRRQRWEAVADDRLYQVHELPGGVLARLAMEGHEVALPVDPPVLPPVQGAASEADALTGALGLGTPSALDTPNSLASQAGSDAGAGLGAPGAGAGGLGTSSGGLGGSAGGIGGSSGGLGAGGTTGPGGAPAGAATASGTQFAAGTQGALAGAAAEAARNSNLPVPQVILFASGEASPFHVDLERDGYEAHWQVDGRADGTLKVTLPGMAVAPDEAPPANPGSHP